MEVDMRANGLLCSATLSLWLVLQSGAAFAQADAGDGCTDEERAASAMFGCVCVDHRAAGGFCDGSGCTQVETRNCASVGAHCVDHACSGGFAPGTGCTARETMNCSNVGCDCRDHMCSGGFCAAPPPADTCSGEDIFLPSEAALESYGLREGLTAHEEHCLELAIASSDTEQDSREGASGVTSGKLSEALTVAEFTTACTAIAVPLYRDEQACPAVMTLGILADKLSGEVQEQGGLVFGHPSALNAFRHFAWTALVSAEFSGRELVEAIARDKSLRLTAIHEYLRRPCNGTQQECEWDDAADGNNNQIGVDFGQTIQDLSLDERTQAIVDKGLDYLVNRATLDFRGGCPSRHKSIPQGC